MVISKGCCSNIDVTDLDAQARTVSLDVLMVSGELELAAGKDATLFDPSKVLDGSKYLRPMVEES